VGFGYACGDRADSDFGDEFDANSRIPIGVFEIVNEFGEIFVGKASRMRIE
jgi:hypothetical protein